MAYFEYLPKVQYNNKQSVYFLAKAKIIQNVFEKYGVFYPYIIRQNETPQIIAYNNYGSPEYDWVVMFSNDTIDPYYDWPLSDTDFNAYMEKRYNKRVPLTKADIKHYKYTGLGSDSQSTINRKSWVMSQETYNQLSAEEQSGWTSVSVYDYEQEKNEEKRKIQLLQANYLPQIVSELRDVFK